MGPTEEQQAPVAPKYLPTVGRMVHYHTRGSADGVFPPTEFAAIVTQVHSDIGDGTTVDLAQFGPTGLRFECGVEQGSEVGKWDWPVLRGPSQSS